MPRRSTVMTLLKRALLAVVAAEVAVVATLIAIDSWRKRVRPKRTSFPRSAPKEMPVGETTVTVYAYGEDLYRDMLDAIRSARHRIMFEVFIFKGDAVGREFKRALIEAAERGVEVHVIYDGFANLVVPRSFFRFPPSVHVLRYPAFRPGVLLLNVRKSGRDHRKILVVDGEIGFIGGYNVGQAYATEWRDTHLRLRGPAVWELQNAFCDFWNANRGPGRPRLDDMGTEHWDARIRTHRNVPEQLIYPIRAMYLEAIDKAKDHIYITQAYFIPDQAILRALLAAARRGVDVRVLMPRNSNHVVADWLSRGLYATLLRGGVGLWLFEDAMVHAKTATIDGRWSTIGTANVDRLSLTGNYEINVEIFDDGVAAHLEEVFHNDSTNARVLTMAEWNRRPLPAKIGETILRPLRPLL
ncbi:phospholipase D-like domain-containing protein [Marinactinospora thermotolerans]|uniref:Cardiolipin synthase n=1 Tax=Marinactinospora thermotolerans DSM 45154 TaxID=1122192 RepID=A0A1T4NLH1_9ACTN|nr:phospholipase D-like domain-containing protein [Marinactinospora thermotolerans]SJZ80054.1 cardiolipin synthase [Marinactinospora thermotolerans DSM 45154]